MNCRKKDGLSLLRKAGGNRGYGEFHILQELWLEMQHHKPQPENSFVINEATLLRELGINARSLPKRIELFGETCGIVFQKICKTIANVSYINWKITLPKSLIFIDSNRLKYRESRGKEDEKPPSPTPPAPTPKPPTPPAPKATKKTAFENSSVFEIEKFKAECPDDWSADEVAYWHGQAIQSSNKGNKYINWILAIKGWKRNSPEQFAQWRAKQTKPGAGPWGSSRPQCPVNSTRDGKRYGCQLKKGHEGPHKFEELFSGTGVRTPGPGRQDTGPEKVSAIIDVPRETS